MGITAAIIWLIGYKGRQKLVTKSPDLPNRPPTLNSCQVKERRWPAMAAIVKSLARLLGSRLKVFGFRV